MKIEFLSNKCKGGTYIEVLSHLSFITESGVTGKFSKQYLTQIFDVTIRFIIEI